VALTKGIGRSIKLRKLTPKFVRPHSILGKVRPVAYEIALPPQLANLHKYFICRNRRSMCLIQPYLSNGWSASQIKLEFQAQLVKVVDQRTKQLKVRLSAWWKCYVMSKLVISLGSWRRPLEKATLPFSLVSQFSRTKIFSCWGECNNLENCHLRVEVVKVEWAPDYFIIKLKISIYRRS